MVITGDVFLFFFGLLALVLMGLSSRNILLAFSSSMIWFSLFMWLFFSPTPPLDVSKNWVQILAWVFLMLTFVPFLMRIDTEIRHERRGQKWTTWGTPPEERRSNATEEYKALIRRRWR